MLRSRKRLARAPGAPRKPSRQSARAPRSVFGCTEAFACGRLYSHRDFNRATSRARTQCAALDAPTSSRHRAWKWRDSLRSEQDAPVGAGRRVAKLDAAALHFVADAVGLREVLRLAGGDARRDALLDPAGIDVLAERCELPARADAFFRLPGRQSQHVGQLPRGP